MSSRRADRALLLFNGGEVTPLLDGRSDVERVAGACRTLQNMFVDEAGAAIRRPGLQFIAEAGSGVELTHVSYEGDAEYYGITELASVSDPPRKYLHLVPNNVAWRRSIASPFTLVGMSAYNRTAYDLTGTRTQQVAAWINVSSGSPYGAGAGVGLDSPADSLESAQWGAIGNPWNNSEPSWSRDRLSKWIDADAFGSPGTADDPLFEYGQGFGRAGGTVGTIRGLGVSPAWNGAGWTVTLFPYSDDGGNQRRVYMRIANGDQDPGTVSNADLYIGDTTGQFTTFTVYLPPDCSVRFYVVHLLLGVEQTSAGMQVPQQIGTTITNGVEAASSLTVDAFDRWVYFAASETLQGELRLEEKLCNEDTLTAAIQRSSGFSVGSAAVAATTFVSGGTAAESNQPIQWTGRVVRTSKVITGLTVGHRYSVQVLVRTNTIGSNDFTTTTEEGEEFVAVATSTQVTYEVRAPLGKEKRVLNITVTDEGAEVAPDEYNPETLAYEGRVIAAGGSLSSTERDIADALVTELKAAGLWSKIVYLLPVLGGTSGCVVPLRDRDLVGNATNANFVSGDYTLAGGLQGNGTTKYLTLPRTPNELGSSDAGGLFWWELGFTGSGNVEPMGTYSNNGARRYVLDLRTTLRALRWGDPTNDAASQATSADNAFYHGERRSSTDRELYRNGASVATDAGSDSISGSNDHDIVAWGSFAGTSSGVLPWPGRGGCCGLTDGTLSDAEALDLYEILRDELMTPAGRI